MNIKEKNKERNVMPILPTGKIQGIFELNKIIGKSLEFFAFAQAAPAKNRDDSLLFSASPRGSLHRHSEYFAQAGRSMIEMLGVLAIVGALSVGGISGYSKAMLQYKVNKDIEIITQIVTNTQTLFAAQTGNCKYTGGRYMFVEEDNSYVCIHNDSYVNYWFPVSLAKQILPDDVLPTGGRISVEATGIYYNSDDIENLNGRGFVINLYEVSQKECMALATYDWGNRATGLIGYSAGANYVVDSWDNPYVRYGCQGNLGPINFHGDTTNTVIACPGGSVVGVPMTPSIASKACANCDDLEFGCYMQFIFE